MALNLVIFKQFENRQIVNALFLIQQKTDYTKYIDL